MDMDAGEVCLLDATHKEVCLTRHRGLAKEAFLEQNRFAVGQGIPGLVVQTGESVIIPDLAYDSRFLRRAVVAAGFTTFAAFPLRARGEVIGSFDLATRQDWTVTKTDLHLLNTVGDVVGMAVADACQYEEFSRAITRLTAKVEQLQRTQDELVAREQLQAVSEPPSVVHDIWSVLGVLRMLSSSN
jgi:GAF domain-containing protein